MPDDVILNKTGIIERCIQRINEEYQDNPENLKNYTRQDSIILNIQRACEACIALAMHIVAERGLGIPNTSREAFDLLVASGLLAESSAKRLKAMVGFRNIAVHDYQKMNLEILREIIDKHLNDLINFAHNCGKRY